VNQTPFRLFKGRAQPTLACWDHAPEPNAIEILTRVYFDGRDWLGVASQHWRGLAARADDEVFSTAAPLNSRSDHAMVARAYLLWSLSDD